MRNKIQHYIFLIFAYLFLLIWNGYTYGHGDTIEVLPYAKWLIDNSLYPHDFFIQNTIQHIPNERYILAQFFSWTGKLMPWVAFLLHFLCSVFLLEGLFRIAKRYIQTEALIWITILLPISIFYGKNLGGNEMYIPLFTSSTLAKALGVWAILYFLEEKIKLAYLLLGVAAFIQPIVSVQLFVILTGVTILSRRSLLALEVKPILLYLLTAGIWIFLMNLNFSEGEIEKALLFEFFEFRVSHHYMPSYFPMKYYILFLPLYFLGLFFTYKKEKKLFWFFVLAMLGMVVYILGVEIFQISSILAAQWFKTTIWLKAFSLISVGAMLEKQILKIDRLKWLMKNEVLLVGSFLMLVIFFYQKNFKDLPYDLPFFTKKNAEITIAEAAKANTPKDAQFIIPIENTYFKYYAERSTFIDYKAVIHRKSIIPIWYERIQEVYGINIQTRRDGNNLGATANDFYKKRTIQDIEAFAKKGIDYWMTFRNVELPLEKIAENEKYVIYKLKSTSVAPRM